MRASDPDQPCYCPPRIASLPQKRCLAKSISEQSAVRLRIFSVSARSTIDFVPFSGDSVEKRHWTDRTWHEGSVPTRIAVRTVLFLVPIEALFKPLKTVLSPFCSCRPFAACVRLQQAHQRNSPPRLLMVGNNYQKQLFLVARANSPAPVIPLPVAVQRGWGRPRYVGRAPRPAGATPAERRSGEPPSRRRNEEQTDLLTPNGVRDTGRRGARRKRFGRASRSSSPCRRRSCWTSQMRFLPPGGALSSGTQGPL